MLIILCGMLCCFLYCLGFWSNGGPTSNLLNRSVTVQFGASASAALAPDATAGEAATVPAYFIDEGNANPLAAWVAMGSPAVPSSEQLKALMAASEVHPVEVQVTAGQRGSEATVLMTPNSAVLLLLPGTGTSTT